MRDRQQQVASLFEAGAVPAKEERESGEGMRDRYSPRTRQSLDERLGHVLEETFRRDLTSVQITTV
jgi:hypothetical protein